MGVLGEATAMLWSWEAILALTLGGMLGYVVGALPGMNSANFVALLLPILILMPTVPAIVFIAAVYGSAETGSAVPAILFNVPGTPGAGATAIEGYALAKQGHAAEALALAVVVSAIGAVFGGILSVSLLNIVGPLALKVGPAEMFGFVLLGLAATGSLTGKGAVRKGLLATTFGALVGLAGGHQLSTVRRGAFGFPELFDGFPLLAVVLGVFGASEALYVIANRARDRRQGVERIEQESSAMHAAKSAFRTIFRYPKALAQASLVGTGMGIIPGVGATATAFVSYGYARAMSKHPEEYGKGSREGLIATELANNSVVPGTLIPLFVLGIPGSSVAAIALTVMLVHGLRPGPSFFRDFHAVGVAVIIGAVIGVIISAIFGLLIAGLLSKLVNIRVGVFVPMVVSLSVIGGLADRGVAFDMLLVLVLGFLGWLMKEAGWPVAAFLIAFLLVGLAEGEFSRALLLGGPSYILSRPVAVVSIVISIFVILLPVGLSMRDARRERRESELQSV